MRVIQGWHISVVVVFFFAGCILLQAGCSSGEPIIAGETQSPYSPPVVAGQIETDEIKESSGLTASECRDVLWTHNDAGNGAFLYAMDMQGKHLGTWSVQGAQNVDWESIASSKDAAGNCTLLIGDIGDNDETRSSVTIYRIPEPVPLANGSTSTSAQPLQTAPAEAMTLTYATAPRDAEALLIHPKTGNIYIVTKAKKGPAEVHKIKPSFGSGAAGKTEKLGDIAMPGKEAGFITGGSFSPDGSRALLCDKDNGYELVLPDAAADPDTIWKQKPVVVNLGDRKQGEGVSYTRDGASIYASSEKKNAPLYLIRRK